MLIIILKYIESWKNIGKYRANYIGGHIGNIGPLAGLDRSLSRDSGHRHQS